MNDQTNNGNQEEMSPEAEAILIEEREAELISADGVMQSRETAENVDGQDTSPNFIMNVTNEALEISRNSSTPQTMDEKSNGDLEEAGNGENMTHVSPELKTVVSNVEKEAIRMSGDAPSCSSNQESSDHCGSGKK